MKPSLVIWDWNGTLLDDVTLCNDCLNELLREYGYPQQYDATAYREIFDFPIIDYYRNAGFDFARHSFEQLAQRFMEIYLPRAEQCGLCPGTKTTLATLKNAGVKQIILSASEQPTLEKQVQEQGLSDFFNKLLGQNNIYGHSKKQTGLAFMEQNNMDPSTIVFVGDTLHDYEVASSMGIKCVLCAAGHQSRQRLGTVDALVIDTLEELPSMLL